MLDNQTCIIDITVKMVYWKLINNVCKKMIDRFQLSCSNSTAAMIVTFQKRGEEAAFTYPFLRQHNSLHSPINPVESDSAGQRGLISQCINAFLIPSEQAIM